MCIKLYCMYNQVREINLVKEGDEMVYGVKLNDCHMMKAWKKLLEVSQYYQRRETVNKFNKLVTRIIIIWSH